MDLAWVFQPVDVRSWCRIGKITRTCLVPCFDGFSSMVFARLVCSAGVGVWRVAIANSMPPGKRKITLATDHVSPPAEFGGGFVSTKQIQLKVRDSDVRRGDNDFTVRDFDGKAYCKVSCAARGVPYPPYCGALHKSANQLHA